MAAYKQCGIDGLQVFSSGAKTAAGARFLTQVASGETFPSNESAREKAADVIAETSPEAAALLRQSREREAARQRIEGQDQQAQGLREQQQAERALLDDVNARLRGDAPAVPPVRPRASVAAAEIAPRSAPFSREQQQARIRQLEQQENQARNVRQQRQAQRGQLDDINQMLQTARR